MASAEGWDRFDRVTLRFVDPELERAYQHADQTDGIRRARIASLVAAAVWVVVGIIGPSAVGASPRDRVGDLRTHGPVPLGDGCGEPLGHHAASTRGDRPRTAVRRRMRRAHPVCGDRDGRDLRHAGDHAHGGVRVRRHTSSVRGLGRDRDGLCLLFFGVAQGNDLGSQLVLQLFVVAATVVVGCVGTYLLERSQRTAYAQGRLVQALHERVDLLLHQYLSPDVARALIEDPDRAALGGIELEVTVLFADLRGYTSFAERRSPAEVVAMLNAAFGASVPIVLEEGGTVVQFMGDAMMAVFNAPSAHPTMLDGRLERLSRCNVPFSRFPIPVGGRSSGSGSIPA